MATNLDGTAAKLNKAVEDAVMRTTSSRAYQELHEGVIEEVLERVMPDLMNRAVLKTVTMLMFGKCDMESLSELSPDQVADAITEGNVGEFETSLVGMVEDAVGKRLSVVSARLLGIVDTLKEMKADNKDDDLLARIKEETVRV
jgi:hypothetical protein